MVLTATVSIGLKMYELTDKRLEQLKESANAEHNPVKYLAIDPGKSNGICGYDVKFYPLFMLTIDADDITKFLTIFENVDKCIIEDYRVYPNKARQHIYSNLETPRVIGRVENWSEKAGVVLIKQLATIKTTGYKWINKKPPPKTDPSNHVMDAHVHFMYWAISKNHIRAEELLKMKNY